MEIIEEKNEIKEEEKSNKEENKSKVNEVNEREILLHLNIKNNKKNSTINYKNKINMINDDMQLISDRNVLKTEVDNIGISHSKKSNNTYMYNYITRPPSLKSLSLRSIKGQNDSNYNGNKNNSFVNKKKKKICKYLSMDNFHHFNDKDSNKKTYSTFINKSSFKNHIEKSFCQHSFSNLSTTNEKSFELISSYENINKITNNMYIKNTSLQSKTKLFLMNECSTLSNDSPNKNIMNKKKVDIKKGIKSSANDFQSEEEEDKKSVNSLDYTKLKSKKKEDFNLININTLTKNKRSRKIMSNVHLDHSNTNSNIKSLESKVSKKN
jgi:hypothetical protein